MIPRVLLLLPTTTYKVRSFMDAAFELGVQVAVGSEKGRALEKHTPGKTLTTDAKLSRYANRHRPETLI